MNSIIVILYFALMWALGISSAKKIKNRADYYAAGRQGSTLFVTGSLVATILGSSAILGSINLSLTQGWAASWLMACAAIGLLALVPFSARVRKFEKYTLPELIDTFYGKPAKRLASAIIPVAWIGVIAAQIIGAAQILATFAGMGYEAGVITSSCVFIGYTIIGGQVSLLRTDLVQSFLIIAGVVLTAILAATSGKVPLHALTAPAFPFNHAFGPWDLVVLLLTYSTTFFVGPDIYSRIFCSRDERTARRSVFATALILAPLGFVFSFIGIYTMHSLPGRAIASSLSFMTALELLLPGWAYSLLAAALLSAVMSTAATTLLTSATIISDLTMKSGLESEHSIRRTKWLIAVLGGLSMAFALKVTSIINSLLIALTIYSGAFIIPVAAGVFGFRSSRRAGTAAMAAGGVIALAGKLLSVFGSAAAGNAIIILAFVTNGIILCAGRFNRHEA